MRFFHKLFGRTKAAEIREKADRVNPNDIWYTVPTISNEFPNTTAPTAQTEFDIFIHEDDYRQNEFLNLDSLILIEEEFVGIKHIWDNYSKKAENYTVFKNCYVRKAIGEPNLKVNFQELKHLLNCHSVGQVFINEEMLVNGFALKTENTTYFGTLSNDKVTQLCISQWSDNTIHEIFRINEAMNLVFVNWYNCDLIKNA